MKRALDQKVWKTGFSFAGTFPGYAYSRDGLQDTALFYKKLTPP